MKFEKELRIYREKTLPEWRDKFLCYKLLKKLLKKNTPIAAGENLPALRELQELFLAILDLELEKFNDFYVDMETLFIIRFQALKERMERLKARGGHNRVFTPDIEFSEELLEIRKQFVSIHGEMILLKGYSSLNFAGLTKILKKYDKRTGELLSLPFNQHASHQPFITTEHLTQLIQECEENFEFLFPLEAEVVEPTEEQRRVRELHSENTLWLGKETVDIYNRTVDTTRTIEELKNGSSTPNPLSMAFLFGRQDHGDTGAVTAENSPCNSFVSMDEDEDEDEDEDDDSCYP